MPVIKPTPSTFTFPEPQLLTALESAVEDIEAWISITDSSNIQPDDDDFARLKSYRAIIDAARRGPA